VGGIGKDASYGKCDRNVNLHHIAPPVWVALIKRKSSHSPFKSEEKRESRHCFIDSP
jgi:hypothetical protein